MPYIKQHLRNGIDCGYTFPETAGELNYLFTKLCMDYMGENESYQKYNDIIGALENCKLELYRRKISFYEDEAIKRNGDVY